MSHIRSKDTIPEKKVRQFLFANGFRYRLHVKTLPGKPDLVLKKHKTVIQVNGCFWHCHKGCKDFKIPDENRDWWSEKLNRNVENDILKYAALKKLGWKVITIWECELKSKRKQETLNTLLLTLRR